MSLTVSNESSGKKTYDPHPPGAYAAVCCDVFEVEQRNSFYGQRSKFTGEVDNRETVTKVCIAFLSTETIEIDGELKPRYTSFWAAKSWHEKGNLRKFVSRWMAGMGKMETFDLEKLIGCGALIQVDNYSRRDGTIGHSVGNAMALPAGMEAPDIPVDFTRHKDKEAKAEAPKERKGSEPIGGYDDETPF